MSSPLHTRVCDLFARRRMCQAAERDPLQVVETADLDVEITLLLGNGIDVALVNGEGEGLGIICQTDRGAVSLVDIEIDDQSSFDLLLIL